MTPASSLSPTRRYEPVLDGLRAVSILFVVIRHFEITTIVSANLGVTILFFISGLIITRLMLVVADANGKIDMLRFWGRRFVRLIPALYLMIAVVVGLALTLGLAVDWGQVLAGLLYVMNYYTIFLRDAGGDYVLPINPLWSLAVEEHYYLVYPFLFAAFWSRPKRLIGVLCAIIALSLLWRIFNITVLGFTSKYNYYATESRIDTILFGCLLALAAAEAACGNPRMRAIINYCSKPWVVALASFLLFATLFGPGEVYRHALRYTLQSILIFMIVAGLLFGSGLGWIRSKLSIAPIVYLGRISYSLYLWHLPVAFFLERAMPATGPVYGWISVVISLLMASASYHWFEKPLINFFAPHFRPRGA